MAGRSECGTITGDTIPFLSGERLAGLGLTMADVVAAIERLIQQRARGIARSAPKAVMLPADGRYQMAALAATDDPPLLATKTVVLNPANPGRGLPQVEGLVTVLDSDTGRPIALLDAKWITAIRTAGLTATAASYLARPDASVVAFIGAGLQARSHLHALAECFPLREVRLLGRGRANIDALQRDAAGRSLGTVVCSSGREALAGADLVVSSVTYSATLEPFLDPDWLAPGAFAAITDLAAPWQRQRFGVLDRVVIDDVEQEAALPNKLVPSAFVHGDLFDLVLGDVAGRSGDDDRTAFIFRGHAIGDLALAVLACQRAGLVPGGPTDG